MGTFWIAAIDHYSKKHREFWGLLDFGGWTIQTSLGHESGIEGLFPFPADSVAIAGESGFRNADKVFFGVIGTLIGDVSSQTSSKRKPAALRPTSTSAGKPTSF
jgi:hypothetical protein